MKDGAKIPASICDKWSRLLDNAHVADLRIALTAILAIVLLANRARSSRTL
jgi:hypothetical protein